MTSSFVNAVRAVFHHFLERFTRAGAIQCRPESGGMSALQSGEYWRAGGSSSIQLEATFEDHVER